MNVSHCQIKIVAIVQRPLRPHLRLANSKTGSLNTLYGAQHNNDRLRNFIYYIDRHIELDGDSHGPMGRELRGDLLARSPHNVEQALHAACSSIKARIALWDGTLSKLCDGRSVEGSVEMFGAD